LEITDPAADTIVRIVVGARFEIRLTENPTTGYRWHYELADKSVLAYLSDDYLSKGTLPGSAGYRSFSFLGSVAGTANIQFKLRRSWESSPPQRALQVLVVVSNP
jgi:predicted secreted protein